MIASSLALGCDSSDGASATNVAARLTDNVRFRLGELIGTGLPQATDDALELVELGPATLLTPGGSRLLAFEITDPDARPVTAILLQFADEDEHLRGEVQEGGGSTTSVVSGELTIDEQLCEGLCDGVLSVDALVAIELEGGGISTPLAMEIALDCRGAGTTGECAVGDADPSAPDLVCEDVTTGGAALTNDPQLDAYFDALRTLALYSDQTDDAAQAALTTIRNALGEDAQDGIPTALEAQIQVSTEAGLLVLVGSPGCAVRAQRVQHTLRVCDFAVSAEQAAVSCAGLCEPGVDRNACMDASGTGCRGVTQDGTCGGVCLGACQVELEEPRACVGTCFGTCDGNCGGDGPGACEGPCTGLCDGECREPISEVCDGLCTGFCEASTDPTAQDPLPSCAMPLQAYCSSAEDNTLVCRGDCFGEASVATGAPICQASALAIGQLSARCDPPVVQIYFAFSPTSEPDEQEAFAQLVETINDPVTNLLILLDRVDLLESAATSLLDVAEGPVAERITAQIEGVQPDSVECAETMVDAATPWLQDQVDRMRELREEILAIAAVLETTGL